MDRLLNMILRRMVNMAMRQGVNAGARKAAGVRGGHKPTQVQKAAMRSTRQSVRILRKMTRF